MTEIERQRRGDADNGVRGQEARDDEREAVEPQPNGDLRVTDVLGRTARLHWSRFHGLIIAMDAPAVYLGQPETLAWIAEAAGDRKHPEPEITDDMVRRGALAMCRMDWKISMGGATTLVKAALEAALRVPAGEADVPR